MFLRSPEQAKRRSVPGYCLTAGKETQCEGQIQTVDSVPLSQPKAGFPGIAEILY